MEAKRMSEYIKRKDVLRIMRRAFDFDYDEETAVENLPTADVVEVVRCKDCVFYEARQKGKPWNVSKKYCSRSATVATQPEDYCSYGERKEQEHE